MLKHTADCYQLSLVFNHFDVSLLLLREQLHKPLVSAKIPLKKQTKHIAVKAQGLFLALLIFIAFGAKEGHIFVEHSRPAIEICDAKAGDVHLHDYERLGHQCSLCDFTFSVFELQLSCFHLNELRNLVVKRDFNYISFNLSRSYFFQSLRAPPFFKYEI